MLKIESKKIKFTERDIVIFEFLSIYGYADFDALYMLTKNFFPCSKSTFKDRLNVLKSSGYLEIGKYNMPRNDKNNPNFEFTLVKGNSKTFSGIGGRRPNVKILKSNFYHELFIIRTLAKLKENGDAAYSEKMDNYPFGDKEIRPDVYCPSLKYGFEVEVSIKRNWLEYRRKFAVLQEQLDDAKRNKKDPKIKKIICLVEKEKDKNLFAKKIENFKNKSVNAEQNFEKYLPNQTVNESFIAMTFDEFWSKKLDSI